MGPNLIKRDMTTKTDTHTHRREVPYAREGRGWVVGLQARAHPKLPAVQQKLGERRLLDAGLPASTAVVSFLLFQAAQSVVLCYGVPER